MRTSQLINTKSLVRLHQERRQQKATSTLIRKTIIAAAKAIVLACEIIAITNRIEEFLPKYEPIKLIPEGKPHLN